MGDVVTGKYQLSLNSWSWFSKRDPLLDFVPVSKKRKVGILSHVINHLIIIVTYKDDIYNFYLYHLKDLMILKFFVEIRLSKK